VKIAFLNDVIYDYAFASERATWATGGAERQQWLLARALASAGWTVTVGVRRRELPDRAEAHADGVRFVGLGQAHILSAWYRFFKAEQPDWWFWQCASHLFGFGVVAAHLAGTRTIFGAGVDRDVRVREALDQRPRWWPVYAFGLSRTDRIVLQHHGQRSELPARWSGKAHVVPNIASPVDRVVPRAERRPTVAWIAALRVAKRPDRLVEIARLLPHIRFIVCGSPSTYMTPAGYSERAIESFRATPNIDYRGQVSPAAAGRVVSESSLLLSTSDEEGFPQTFLEAWSYGTPVVTTGIDPDGAIRDVPLGAVCSDVHATAAAIADLAGDAMWWQRVSDNARHYVNRAHSPAAAISALERAVSGAGSNRGVGATPTRVAV
jgi:glycosyltransferase involved in cell wall biosynthesis